MQDQKKVKKKQGHHRRQNSIQFLQQQEKICIAKKQKKSQQISNNLNLEKQENDLVKQIIQREIDDVQTKIISIESLEEDEKSDKKLESGFQAFRQQKQYKVNLNGEKLKNIEKYCDKDMGLSAIEENTEQESSSKKTYSSAVVDGKSHHKNQSSNFFSNENSVKNFNFLKNKNSEIQQNLHENDSAFKTKKVKNMNLQFYQNENEQVNAMFYKKTQKKDKSKNLHRKINSVTFQIGKHDNQIILDKPKIEKRSISPNDLEEFQNRKRIKILSKQNKRQNEQIKFDKMKKKSMFSKTFNNIKIKDQQIPLINKKKNKDSLKKVKKGKVQKKSFKLITSDGFKFRRPKNYTKPIKINLNVTGEQLYQKSFVQNLIFKQPISTRPNKKITFLDKFF